MTTPESRNRRTMLITGLITVATAFALGHFELPTWPAAMPMVTGLAVVLRRGGK